MQPREVDDSLDRVADNLAGHGEFGKAVALAALRARLADLPLPSAHGDFRHRLLALLHGAGRGPLHADYVPSELVARLHAAAAAAAAGQPTYLSEGSSGGDDDSDGESEGESAGSAFSSGDSLSGTEAGLVVVGWLGGIVIESRPAAWYW